MEWFGMTAFILVTFEMLLCFESLHCEVRLQHGAVLVQFLSTLNSNMNKLFGSVYVLPHFSESKMILNIEIKISNSQTIVRLTDIVIFMVFKIQYSRG